MQESNLKQDGNTLSVTLMFSGTGDTQWDGFGRNNNHSDVVSKLYNVGNLVTFQLRFIWLRNHQNRHNALSNANSNLYLVRFNAANSDNMKITVKLECPLFNPKQKDFKVDNIWYLIHEQSNLNGNFMFTGTVTVDTKMYTEKGRNTSFAPLHDDEQLTDFELRGEDGVVYVHSAVLAACSPVLRAMLEKNWRETTERSLKIPDVSKATLQHLKDYMYIDKLPDAGVENLLLIASCYMMDDLERLCTDRLIHSLTAHNAMELSKFALMNNLTKLYMAFLERIEGGFVKVRDINKNA